MNKHLVWACAVVLTTFMIIGYLSCQHTDDRIQECIKFGKDPHQCACTFASSSTSGCFPKE